MNQTLSRSVLLVVAACLLVAITGCDRCSSPEDEQELPWRFVSEDASYDVVFPPEWSAEPPGNINPHADLAAHREDRFFFLVIPQQLPTFPNPDVFQLQQRALERLDESVEQLVIERQGPLELDGVSGLTVFARGDVNGDSVSYITSYVIDNGMGYQIIAFTDEDHAAELFDETDRILSSWRFLDDDDTTASEPTPPPDHGTEAPDHGPLPDDEQTHEPDPSH